MEVIIIALTLLIIAIMFFSPRLRVWIPVVLLPIIWYLPRQTAPGGLLENYLIVRWLTFIIIPFLFILQFLRNIYFLKSFKLTNIFLPLMAFICISIFSVIYNKQDFFPAVGGILQYVRYPLLFMALINMEISSNVMELFLKLFFILIIIQIPECLYRYFVLGISWDYLSWSLGPWGTFDLGIYMLYATALLIGIAMIKHFRIWHIVVIACFFALAIFGEIKAFLFAAPIVAIIVILVVIWKVQRKRIILAFSIISLLLIFIFASYSLWQSVYSEESNILAMNLGRLDEGRSIDRVNAMSLAWEYLIRDPMVFFFGYGPGSSFSGAFFADGGILAEIPMAYKNQFVSMFSDSGAMGIIFYYLMIFMIPFSIIKKGWSSQNDNIVIISMALSGIWFFYAFLGPFYDLIWRHDSPNFIFYFFVAAIYIYTMKDKTKTNKLTTSPGI
jgi:hypothetical protein